MTQQINTNILKIEEISIMVLGVPKTNPIQLTSDMIIYDSKNSTVNLTNKLPFITGSLKYNEKYLFDLSIKQFNKLLEFFFNVDEFKKRCNIMNGPNTPIETIKKKYNENIEKNVEIMLTLLFPTKFPVIRNFNTSYNQFIKGESVSDISYKIGVSVNEEGMVTTGNNYSYIKLNNGEYTITKILWLNDIFNHPIYRVFIDEYVDYIQKSGERNSNIVLAINNAIAKLATRFIKTEKNNFDLSEYKNTIETEYNEIFGKSDIKDKDKKNKDRTQFSLDNEKKQYDDDIKTLYDLLNTFGYEYIGNPEYIISDINNLDVINNLDDINKLNLYEKLYNGYKQNLPNIKNKYKNGEELSNDEKNIFKNDQERIKHITNMYTRVYNIREVYKRIKSNKRSSLKLNPEFENKIDNIVKELRKIVISIKIKENYITDDNKINTKIDGEEEDVMNELKTKYKFFLDFLERINDLNFPKRFSTNETLQDMISKYSSGNETDGFSNVLTEIISIIVKNSSNSLSQDEYYNVGVTQINPNDDKLPKYEIYVSFDLIEGKMDDAMLEKVGCIYNGIELGTSAQNYEMSNNKYNALFSKVFIQKSQYENNTSNKQNTEPLPTPPSKNTTEPIAPIQPPPDGSAKGGKNIAKRRFRTHKRKNKNKKRKQTRKRNRKI